MEVSLQVATLEEDVKLLKAEIKTVLKEIRAAVLNNDNPFTAAGAAPASSTPEPAAPTPKPEAAATPPPSPAPTLVQPVVTPAPVPPQPVAPPAPVPPQPAAPTPPIVPPNAVSMAQYGAPPAANAVPPYGPPGGGPMSPYGPPGGGPMPPYGYPSGRPMSPFGYPSGGPMSQFGPPGGGPMSPFGPPGGGPMSPGQLPRSSMGPMAGPAGERSASGHELGGPQEQGPSGPLSSRDKTPATAADQRLHLLTIAGLMSWAEDAVKTLGSERFEIVLELGAATDLLTPVTRDVLAKIATLIPSSQRSDQPMNVIDCLVVLRQLDAILQGETIAKLPLKRAADQDQAA